MFHAGDFGGRSTQRGLDPRDWESRREHLVAHMRSNHDRDSRDRQGRRLCYGGEGGDASGGEGRCRDGGGGLGGGGGGDYDLAGNRVDLNLKYGMFRSIAQLWMTGLFRELGREPGGA